MSWILAIDQSTSATKALLFDGDGRCRDKALREHAQLHPRPGWVEHDAEEIWRNVLAVSGEVLDRNSKAAAKLAGISLTNQRETVVVFSRKGGRPVRPAIVWQCRRGDALCREQAEAGRSELIHARTGLRLDAYFSASKLQWLMREERALAAQLESGAALCGTIDTYLLYRLTGGKVFATDATNASRTLLFDIQRLRWDPELCALWQVPRNALPDVRDCTARFGETTLDGRLSRPVPICGVMGDSQAALLAQGCLQPGATKMTLGTGTSILMNVGKAPRFSERGVLTALAWVCHGKPTYALEGLVLSSAATLAWLRDGLGLIRDFSECERIAAALKDNGGVYLVPAFSGLGLPYWDPTARGAVLGLSTGSDRRHLVRAGLESIAYQAQDALAAMREEAGIRVEPVRADGGATENRWLMQFIADITGADVTVAPIPECSGLGAAMAGRVGLGLAGSLEELAAAASSGRVYRPALPRDEADRLYSAWQAAVRRVLPLDGISAHS